MPSSLICTLWYFDTLNFCLAMNCITCNCYSILAMHRNTFPCLNSWHTIQCTIQDMDLHYMYLTSSWLCLEWYKIFYQQNINFHYYGHCCTARNINLNFKTIQEGPRVIPHIIMYSKCKIIHSVSTVEPSRVEQIPTVWLVTGDSWLMNCFYLTKVSESTRSRL